MSAERSPLPPDTLGYAYNRGGLNNQKIALFGLFLRAFREGPRRIVLPDLVIFDQITFKHPRVPIGQGYHLEPLRAFAARHDIEIVDAPPGGDEGGWDHFHLGRDFIPFAAISDALGPDSFTCEFFRSLEPTILQSDALRRVREAAFGDKGIRLVAQMRIERDWEFHTDHRLSPVVSNTENNNPSFKDIVGKICNTPGLEERRAYVVCDEAALPVSKDEIRDTVRREFGLELYWKSDFLEPDELGALSLLNLSCLDFEMAVGAEAFVGLTRSTFSNMAGVEKYARTRMAVARHYIYNLSGPSLGARTDNGAFSVPELAIASEGDRSKRVFDLAEIYRGAGAREKALAAYLLCADTEGADQEEAYLSLYAAAQLKAELNYPAEEILKTFNRASERMPSRAEAAHGASRYCRIHRRHGEGYEIAAKAIDTPMPAQGRQLEPWIYERGLLDEYAVNACRSDHHIECVLACMEILKRNNNLSKADHQRIVSNARVSLEKLADGGKVAGDPGRSISAIHRGKSGWISDKWASYLRYYDSAFSPWRDKKISLLEVGVQNGGSLETWASYFARGSLFVGCDIDERCLQLTYADDRIKIVVGDVNEDYAFQNITNICSEFDIIIDDGSHLSKDVISTFIKYFPLIKPGGIFVVEDTHALYWQNFGGGITNEQAAHALFRKLADVVSFEFWSEDCSIETYLRPFFGEGPVPEFITAGWIEAVEFRNSLITITKSIEPGHGKLGERIVSGSISL